MTMMMVNMRMMLMMMMTMMMIVIQKTRSPIVSWPQTQVITAIDNWPFPFILMIAMMMMMRIDWSENQSNYFYQLFPQIHKFSCMPYFLPYWFLFSRNMAKITKTFWWKWWWCWQSCCWWCRWWWWWLRWWWSLSSWQSQTWQPPDKPCSHQNTQPASFNFTLRWEGAKGFRCGHMKKL